MKNNETTSMTITLTASQWADLHDLLCDSLDYIGNSSDSQFTTIQEVLQQIN